MTTHIKNKKFKPLHLTGCKDDMKTAAIFKLVKHWYTRRELITCFDFEKNLSVLRIKLQQRGPTSLSSPSVDLAPFQLGKLTVLRAPQCAAPCAAATLFLNLSAGLWEVKNTGMNYLVFNYIIICEKY